MFIAACFSVCSAGALASLAVVPQRCNVLPFCVGVFDLARFHASSLNPSRFNKEGEHRRRTIGGAYRRGILLFDPESIRDTLSREENTIQGRQRLLPSLLYRQANNIHGVDDRENDRKRYMSTKYPMVGRPN